MNPRPDIEPDSRLSLSTSAVSTSLPDGTVILDPVSGRYFGLEGVGTMAWDLLARTTSLSEMVVAITATYDVEAATCEDDLRNMVNDLLDRGLVTVEHADA